MPVEIVDLRRWINWLDDDSTHDPELERLAEDATETVERHVRRALITQSWQWTTDRASVFELPRPPIQSVTSVRVFDRDDQPTVVDPSDYLLLADRSPAVIVMDRDYQWPELRDHQPVEITFVTGFGDAASDVPRSYRTAIMQIVAFEFEHRGDRDIDMPKHIRAKLRGLASGTTAGFFAGKMG